LLNGPALCPHSGSIAWQFASGGPPCPPPVAEATAEPMEPITPEEKLVRAASEGDLDAFEVLVRRYQARVVTTACQLLGDEAEADDVSQEVWIRVYRSLPRFQFRSRFSTWLYRITVNQSLTALKKRQHRLGARKMDVRIDQIEADGVGEGGYPLPSDAPGPRRILEGKELHAAFRRALANLSIKQRLAVTLVLFQDLSHREAGRAMGIREKTVSWHLFKARARLLEELKEHLQ